MKNIIIPLTHDLINREDIEQLSYRLVTHENDNSIIPSQTIKLRIVYKNETHQSIKRNPWWIVNPPSNLMIYNDQFLIIEYDEFVERAFHINGIVVNNMNVINHSDSYVTFEYEIEPKQSLFITEVANDIFTKYLKDNDNFDWHQINPEIHTTYVY